MMYVFKWSDIADQHYYMCHIHISTVYMLRFIQIQMNRLFQ